MLKATLKVVGGDAKSTELQLKLPTTIGRAREATLTLPHPLVSRFHCELFERDGKLYVKDLGSLNGTFVDNKKLEGETVLYPEQLLTIGNVTFRALYQIGDATSPVADPSAEEVVFTEEQVPSAQNTPGIHDKKTEPGKRPTPEKAAENDKAADSLETVYMASDSSSVHEDLDSEHDGTPHHDTPAHSIISALADMEETKPQQAASLSSLEKLEVDGKPIPDPVSGIDIHDDDLPQDNRVGQSFLNVVAENQQNDEKVSADESSLESFIRKMPK